jgi:ATP-dependent Clp protease ATP-binding subunit ClpA
MFERFTDKARNVVILAKAKATERGDDQIRPVHMLYGLAATDGVAGRALTALGADAAAVERELDRAGGASPGSLGPREEAADADAEALAAIGIDLDEIKRRIEESFGPGALERVPLTPKGPLNWTGRLPLNEASKLALALSIKEARALRHSYVGTEHLLLGLLQVAERYPHGEFATATLPDLGLDPATARDRVLAELSEMLRAQPPGR